MKFKGTVIGQASGSVASLTFSHNRGGQYIRNRAIPVQPGTPEQQAVKSILAQLSARWVTTLSEAERDAWDNYAAQVPLPNPLGDPRNVGGIAMYNRSNVSRLQAALTRIDDAPTTFDLGDFTAPVFAAPSAGAGTVSVAFTVEDDWVEETGAAMLIYASRGVNASRNFFKGPYRFAGLIAGNATTPPTSPQVITLPFPITATQAVFFRVRVTRADARLSNDFRDRQLAVA